MNPQAFPGRAHAAALAAALCAAQASAQTAQSNDADQAVQQVVVSGMRASLEKAQDLKRRADQVFDSIVADDIGKLPDTNVAEALQRITGVQVSRNRPDGHRGQLADNGPYPASMSTPEGQKRFMAELLSTLRRARWACCTGIRS